MKERLAFWRDQLLGCIMFAILGAIFFRSLRDILLFTACAYAVAFILAELGVLLGIVERKK